VNSFARRAQRQQPPAPAIPARVLLPANARKKSAHGKVHKNRRPQASCVTPNKWPRSEKTRQAGTKLPCRMTEFPARLNRLILEPRPPPPWHSIPSGANPKLPPGPSSHRLLTPFNSGPRASGAPQLHDFRQPLNRGACELVKTQANSRLLKKASECPPSPRQPGRWMPSPGPPA